MAYSDYIIGHNLGSIEIDGILYRILEIRQSTITRDQEIDLMSISGEKKTIRYNAPEQPEIYQGGKD